MRALARGLAALLDGLARGALAVSAAALLAMTVVVAWGVFGRFVLNDTPAWAEASALLLLGWVILGAAALGVRENFHMGFGSLRDALPAALAGALDAASDAVVAGFGLVMSWYGTELAVAVWNATLPTLGLPGAVEYAPLALGGLLIALFGVERLAVRAATGHAPAAAAADHPILTDA